MDKLKYITIKGTFPKHPKTQKLIEKFGGAAPFALTVLWAFAARFKPDGVLTDMDDDDIAYAADWDGDPSEFVSALVSCGFLDSTPDGYSIHNWKKHQGLE